MDAAAAAVEDGGRVADEDYAAAAAAGRNGSVGNRLDVSERVQREENTETTETAAENFCWAPW